MMAFSTPPSLRTPPLSHIRAQTGEVIGYQFVKLGKMMEDIRHGKTPNEAYEKNVGTYGRFSKEAGAVKYIDPREE